MGEYRWGAASVAATMATVIASAATAQPAGVHQYADLALSPTGQRIATVDTVEPFADTTSEPHGRIVVRSAADGRVLASYDPCPACRYAGLAWSPDGAALAFVASDVKAGTASLDLVRDGRVQVVSVVHGVASTPRWSPDGGTLAVLAVVGAHKQTGAVEAGAAQVGDIGAVTVEDEQRIAVAPVAGGALRLVSPADTWVYEYDWTPDGRGFVATAAKGNGDDNWWIAKLAAVNLADGATRVIAAPDMQMDYPRVSPDGRSVAFIGGLMSDFGPVGGDIYTVPIGGGAPTDQTLGYKGTFTSLMWRSDALYGTATLRGDDAVYRLRPDQGGVAILAKLEATLLAGDARVAVSADGRLGAAESQGFDQPPRIVVGPLAAMAPVTQDNDAIRPALSARSVEWADGGFDVQGWLLGPRQPTGGAHPMVTLVHGGPSSAYTPFYSPPHHGLFPVQEMIDRGYYVFLPNPRGSYGQGEAFTRANIRDFGGGDLKDILAGVDAVEKIAAVDERRLGIMGASYGGFMTMWAVTHTNRFHAAEADAGLSDWISYYGENGIDKWMIPFFGASAYDDPAIYRKLSPIDYIKNVRTPTLITVGEDDVECPAPQSFEFFRGLQAVGVPTDLIVYAGQGHAIRDPADLADARRRILGWFDKYLGS